MPRARPCPRAPACAWVCVATAAADPVVPAEPTHHPLRDSQRLYGCEETAGLAEVVLAEPVGRVRWAAGHLLATVLGTAVALAALGLGAGIGFGDPLPILGATLAYLPACLVLAGLAVAVYGWLPAAAAPAAWTVFGLTLLIDLLSEFRLVDSAVTDLSPFVRTLQPLVTGDGLAVALLGLLAVAVALGALGLAGLTRRDLG